MSTGYLSLGRRRGEVTGRICDVGQKGLQHSFKQETVAAPVTATFSSLWNSSLRPLLEIE